MNVGNFTTAGNSNVYYAYALAIHEPAGEDFIKFTLRWTFTGSLVLKNYNKFNAAISYKYIDDHPANENNSIFAGWYLVADLNMSYNFSKRLTAGVSVQNLFNLAWNETQFATKSRLRNEQIR